MKKRFLAIAIATTLVSPLAANADVTTYGLVHMSVGAIDDGNTGTTDNFQVRSHASRLGFKGSDDLGNGLSANWKLEYGVNPDSAGDGISARNQYIGLKGGFGEIRVGKHDTPLKVAQGKFDQFGDTDADISGALGLSNGENRLNNTMTYINKFGDVTALITLIPGEGTGVSGAGASGDGIADTTSIAAMWKSGPAFVSLAIDSYDDTSTTATADDLTRLVATYKMGKMDFGFLMESLGATTGNADEDLMGLSFAMGMGKNKVKFQYMDKEVDNNGAETTQVSLGYDMMLSKKTTAYIMYTDAEEETGAATTDEHTFMGVGMVTKF